MCRWFAYISDKEGCLLEDVLICPPHSLVKQVNEHFLPEIIPQVPVKTPYASLPDEPTAKFLNQYLNTDGFGMAWYTSTFSTFSPSSPDHCEKPRLHPTLYKTIQPPINDTNFRSLCANSASNVVLAHIRATSGAGVVSNNNHPFIFGIHTFMHNGYIDKFLRIKKEMIKLISADAYDNVQGTTDSEHFAALFMTYLCPSKGTDVPHTPNPDSRETTADAIPLEWEKFHTPEQLKEALHKTIATIINLQKRILGADANSNFFNICVTDGHSLVASRFRNHPTMQPTSLYYSTTAGATLDRRYPDNPDGPQGPKGCAKGNECLGYNAEAIKDTREHEKHLIIASEPCTYNVNEWQLVKKNYMILSEGGVVKKVEPIVLDDVMVPGDSY